MDKKSNKIMSEFFLELFTEEVPAKLQTNARKILLDNFTKLFNEKNISFKKNSVYSVPNRLVIYFDGIDKEILEKKEEKKGPSTTAPDQALEGFLRSNNITNEDVFIKKIEKGEFYFFIKAEKKIKTLDIIKQSLPTILDKIDWKKSMRWADYSLSWARPLKSILAIFDGKILEFNYHHLSSSNFTILDKEFEDKTKKISSFKSYREIIKKLNIILDHNLRKDFIKKEIYKISKKKNIFVDINQNLLEEVTNLVEQPNILLCKFDKKFLHIPKEILIVTMQNHQKYFHTFDSKGNITNQFFVVANNRDNKGYIKLGNERVVDARLNDAEFFWEKNKSESLIKQISKLKNINYFKGLGTYYDKTQRIKKLSGLISDELLISKEKIEVASSICKVDLLSDLVGEFPELQGILGGYFAENQGFEKDICLAISEHYLPIGNDSRIPKKSYSIALSLGDKIDSLVGFFGINLKPTSSKDPYALRRMTIGLIKIILDNNQKIKIKDLINYSCLLYKDQNSKFDTKIVKNDLLEFIQERFKNVMKEKGIRQDIIESSTMSFKVDGILKIYKKASTLNKLILKDTGKDVISIYKRAYSILKDELKNPTSQISGSADPGLFKNDFEKNLYKKIHEIRKDFTSVAKEDDYESLLNSLASVKKEITEFFDNVKVNDEEDMLRKNRLELLQMLCKTFDNYFNFSRLESLS